MELSKLISWGGGWASHFFYEDAIHRMITNRKQNFLLAKEVSKNAKGHSAHRCFAKYNQLTGFKSQNEIETTTVECASVINVCDYKSTNIIYEPKYWLDLLEDHTDGRNLSIVAKEIWSTEPKLPVGIAIKLLKEWSFPILSDLFPLADTGKAPLFVKTNLADFSWRKWFLLKNDVPLWIYSSNDFKMPCSQYLVWKLIHEACHILHLQNYPKAGQISDPNWLLQMEGVAMAAEMRFLNLIQKENNISLPKGIPFNRFNIIFVLLLGFLERSLRFEYDITLYQEKLQPEEWIIKTKSKYKIDIKIFDFAFEFHNMPGFLGGYLIGMEKYLSHPNESRLLQGQTRLF